MKSKISYCISLLIVFVSMESFAQLTKDSIQAQFPMGNFVSLKDNIACYRLKGKKNGGMYGFCRYDSTYKSLYSRKTYTFDKINGKVAKILNSNCYTIIAPIYDYALPFSEGWAPVCMNKKWTYVSEDGDYLFDFILEAAYPFKNGKAKVVFDGIEYVISRAGEGLPKHAYVDTFERELELKANTISQLLSESQYEKALEAGKAIYETLVKVQNNQLPELSASAFLNGCQIAFSAMSAQNSLMAFTCNSDTSLFDKYRNIKLERFLSFESRHPAINKYNAELYFSLFRSEYARECKDIILEMDRADYKSAIIKLEKWISKNHIKIEDDFSLMMTYYYLSELSDDFESANVILVQMAKVYEANNGRLDLDGLPLGVFLADIKRCKSAESVFLTLEQQFRKKKKYEELFCLYYNIALLYKSVNKIQKSIHYLSQALKIKLPEGQEAIKLECMSDLINLELGLGNVDTYLLTEYVNAEIDYNARVFEQNNSLMINRLWGNSVERMQRVFEYLDTCKDPIYLQSAFALSVFQKGIVFDIEKYLSKRINTSDNPSLQQQYREYLEQKSKYKGIDVFDLISVTDSRRDSIYSRFNMEGEIKQTIIAQYKNYVPTSHYKKFLTRDINNVGMIDVVVHRDSCNLYKLGVFLNAPNGSLSYIPVSIQDEFSKDDFWKAIDLSSSFKTEDDIYACYGVLDTLGLEYYKTNSGVSPYNKYRLHRSSSLANIFNKVDTYSNNNVVLYGGLYYGAIKSSRRRGAGKGFLENSKVEIDAIAEILEKQGMEIFIKEEEEGTTESILQLSGKSPRILHLATHGYFLPKEHHFNPLEDRFNYYGQNTDIKQREWLMNNSGFFTSIDSLGNTIMYSNEIASCDSSQTKLVVLSACSTMSGIGSDGDAQIVGLTTAFSLASVQNIISSLNDVDDEKASEFMITFYNIYAGASDLYESFRRTVLKMQEKYPETPYYWNSFVLIEN